MEHPSRELVPTREKNTFFRLSAWRDQVLELITSDAFLVGPMMRRNEMLPVLGDGLRTSRCRARGYRGGFPSPAPPMRQSTSGSMR